MEIVTLISKEGEEIEVDEEVVTSSGTIMYMLGFRDNVDRKVVSLPLLNANVLRKVIEWATYHNKNHVHNHRHKVLGDQFEINEENNNNIEESEETERLKIDEDNLREHCWECDIDDQDSEETDDQSMEADGNDEALRNAIWDDNYFNIETSMFLELLFAAHYLKMYEFMAVLRKKFYEMISGKNLQDISEMFGMEL